MTDPTLDIPIDFDPLPEALEDSGVIDLSALLAERRAQEARGEEGSSAGIASAHTVSIFCGRKTGRLTFQPTISRAGGGASLAPGENYRFQIILGSHRLGAGTRIALGQSE